MIVCVEGRGSAEEVFHALRSVEPGTPSRTVCDEDAGAMPQMQETWAKRTARPCRRCFPPAAEDGHGDTEQPASGAGEDVVLYTSEGATCGPNWPSGCELPADNPNRVPLPSSSSK